MSKARRAARPLPRRCGSGRGRAEQLGSPLGCCRHPRASALSRRKKGIPPGSRTTGRPPGAAPRPQAKPRRLQTRAHARESWLHWRDRCPGPRRCGVRRRASGERERPPARAAECAARRVLVPPHGRDPRPLSQTDSRPAQAASRPRGPPILHAGAPHWLRSLFLEVPFIPARQRISCPPSGPSN